MHILATQQSHAQVIIPRKNSYLCTSTYGHSSLKLKIKCSQQLYRAAQTNFKGKLLGQTSGSTVKLPVRISTSQYHQSAWVQVLALLQFQLPPNACHGGQQVTATVINPWHPSGRLGGLQQFNQHLKPLWRKKTEIPRERRHCMWILKNQAARSALTRVSSLPPALLLSHFPVSRIMWHHKLSLLLSLPHHFLSPTCHSLSLSLLLSVLRLYPIDSISLENPN